MPSATSVRRFLLWLLLLCSTVAHAQTPLPPQNIDELYNEFIKIRDLQEFTVDDIEWTFMKECYADQCFGTNPDSPYGMPNFAPGSPNGFLASRMNELDAFVVLMETPPKHRYFSVTPYIFTRQYDDGNGNVSTVDVFESLSDSVNTNTVVTWPGGSDAPFSELAVFIQAADHNSFDKIETYLKDRLLVPGQAIHTLVMPFDRLSLRMNMNPGADTFTLLMRMAYPENESEADAYVKRDPKPVRFMHLKRILPPNDPPPSIQARNPHERRLPRECPPEPVPVGECPPNDQTYAAARDELMAAVVQHFSSRYNFDPSLLIGPELMFGTTGRFPCTTLRMRCNGDAPDAVYSKDIHLEGGLSRFRDRLLIVGVNHQKTGAVTYMSHSVNRVLKNKGIVGVSDGDWLEQTARFFIHDNPNSIYDDLYAVIFAYECGEEEVDYCIEIPRDRRDGIPPGEAMKVAGRFYLDEQTDTRPGKSLLTPHRVVRMTLK